MAEVDESAVEIDESVGVLGKEVASGMKSHGVNSTALAHLPRSLRFAILMVLGRFSE
jgi:hypothetical protein